MIDFQNLTEAIQMYFIPNGHDSIKGFSYKETFNGDSAVMTNFLKTKTDGDYQLEISKESDEDGEFCHVKVAKIIDGNEYLLLIANYITCITELLVMVNFATRVYIK
jgi:hypothetical protein